MVAKNDGTLVIVILRLTAIDPMALSFIGSNWSGHCILPDAGVAIAVPTAAPVDWLPDGKCVLMVVVGGAFTQLLADDNLLYTVGNNAHGQLGRGHVGNSDPDNRVPRPVTGFGLERITQIAAGDSHCAAVTEGGKLFLWGLNASGQCGTGVASGHVITASRCDSGALADADVRVVYVACGGIHTVALASDGGVIAFGGNTFGQLGTGSNDDTPTPERLSCAALVGAGIVGCAAGGNFTQLVSDDGRVFAVGLNVCGQLGTGDMTSVNTPTAIDAAHFGGAPVAAVACGYCHTLAITRGEGRVFCWGRGTHGATGLGHTGDAATPRPVVGALADARVVRMCAGNSHSCALTEDGRVFVFGSGVGITVAGNHGTPQVLQEGALAGTTVRALGAGCRGTHAAFLAGPPPTAPGFEAPLAYALQKKPAPKVPKHAAAAAAVVAAAAAQSSGGGAASAGSGQGTKRKRGDQSDDDDSGAHGEGSNDL